MALLTYTAVRVGLFSLLGLLFYWCGLGAIPSIVTAAIGALCLAYLFFSRQRADAARALERLVHRPRTGPRPDSDVVVEDQAIDSQLEALDGLSSGATDQAGHQGSRSSPKA